MGPAFQGHLVRVLRNIRKNSKCSVVPLSFATKCKWAAASHPWWASPGHLGLVAWDVTWELFILMWILVCQVSWGYQPLGTLHLSKLKLLRVSLKHPLDLWDSMFLPASSHQSGTKSSLTAPGLIPTPLFFLRHAGLWFIPGLLAWNSCSSLVLPRLKSIWYPPHKSIWYLKMIHIAG